MGLPTDLLHYFSINTRLNKGGVIGPLSVGDYTNENPTLNGPEIRLICQKLVNEGLLTHSGNRNNNPIFGDCFISLGYNQDLADYGSYNFLITGLGSIRTHFKDSVRPVIVENRNQIPGIGTCFVLQKNVLITARHCVEDMSSIKIPDLNGGFLQVEEILTAGAPQMDVAILVLKGSPFSSVPGFKMASANVLDDVLSMGYPPIPGFDAIQIAEKGSINSNLKVSAGNLIGQAKSYWGDQEFILINAKVKGGNSGGPVIDKLGRVVGILVDIPADLDNPSEFDKLGYGVAIPGLDLIDFCNKCRTEDSAIKPIKFQNQDVGFSTLLDNPNRKPYLDDQYE